MEIIPLLQGCYYLQNNAEAALFGAPAEIIKHLLRKNKIIPTTVIVPEVAYVEGMSQIALEFLLYWQLFFSKTEEKQKPFRVIASEKMNVRIRESLLITLFGPTEEQMKKWGLPKERITMLMSMMSYMSIKNSNGSKMVLDDLVEFISFSKDQNTVQLFSGHKIFVKQQEKSVFEVLDEQESKIIDLNFKGSQLSLTPAMDQNMEIPQVLRARLLGSYSGFDPDGPTTGMLMWINCNAFLVDGPVGTSFYLKRIGISKSDIVGVILSHVHEDHCTLIDMIMSEQTVNIITTREIYECMLIKVANSLGESVEEVRLYLVFTQIIPGIEMKMYGATWEFFYTAHSIPTIGFRVSVKDTAGSWHSIVHTSDTADFSTLERMFQAKAITRTHKDQLTNLVRGNESLVMVDGGGPPIHGNPDDYKDAITTYKNTDFLFYHVNPSKINTQKYMVATPGWNKTYLKKVQLDDSLLLKLMRTLKLLEVDESFWVNIILSQGQVLEISSGIEIVKQGQTGDSFFFVLTGNAEVIEAAENKVIALLESGDFFGEMSIIKGINRNATVKAVSPCILFKIPGDLFMDFVEANGLLEKFERLWLSRTLISKVSIFRNLRPHARHQIALLAKRAVFHDGFTVISKGDTCNDFYIITKGCAKITMGDTEKESVLNELGPGDFFGENVAMGYMPRRNATVWAKGELETLTITAAKLQQLAKNAPLLTHELHLVMRDRGVTKFPHSRRECL